MDTTIELVDNDILTPVPLASEIELIEEREEQEVRLIEDRIFYASLSQQLTSHNTDYCECED